MKNKIIKIYKDITIIGGGVPGIVSAVQAARLGLTVALINNRGYMGGNASAEIAVSICGATGMQEFNYFSRETGVLEELLLENKHKNVMGNRYVWDSLITDKLLNEPNIEIFANTNVDSVNVKDSKIISVSGSQLASDKRFEFISPLFADDTGDGTVGYLAGAEYKYGREAKDEYGEKIAPETADNHVLPSTLDFVAKDVGKPVKFVRPSFAVNLFESDVLKYRIIPKKGFEKCQWFYEIDGDKNQMEDAEKIIQDHKSLVYGIWDYIKNSGEYESENYDLQYVSSVPGKREGRRMMGDYVLTENDILNQSDFNDTVGYGGWSIDLHAIRGFYATEPINMHVMLDGIYKIPYRCGYSKNIENLFIEGRCMSVSHIAHGTTRVMATLCTVAQANAVSAYLCKKYNETPRGIYENHLDELQTILMRFDQFIPGKPYKDTDNLAQSAKIEVSSVHELSMIQNDKIDILERDTSISFPVLKTFKGIRVLLRAKKDTCLNYWAAIPEKEENFNPETRVFEGKINIFASDSFKWITLPADVTVPNSLNMFFVLCANENIEIACQDESLAGVFCQQKHKNNSITIIDRKTLKPKDEIWYGYYNVCFETIEKEPVFEGANMLNGYTRPFMGANIWLSKGLKDESFVLTLDKKQKLNKMVLVFDSSLNSAISCFSESKETEFKCMVKAFDVYYKNENGDFCLKAEVKNNYQRLAYVPLDDIQSDTIKVVFKQTWGQSFIGVYGIHIYKNETEEL